jgi:hypothetical protein
MSPLRPNVEFLEAALFVHRAKVSKQIVEAHSQVLSETTAKYPITRSFIIAHTTSECMIVRVVT